MLGWDVAYDDIVRVQTGHTTRYIGKGGRHVVPSGDVVALCGRSGLHVFVGSGWDVSSSAQSCPTCETAMQALTRAPGQLDAGLRL